MPALAALLLASAALSASDRKALDATTRQIYAPYSRETNYEAVWERDIWSADMRRLIDKWQTVVPEGEVDAMNDGDWICQCQDWDSKKFRVKITKREAKGRDAALIGVDFNLGHGEPRDAYFEFRRENGRWLIDDIYSEPYSDGIKAELIRTIADDEALLKAKQ
jgi:hypothetical protein